MCYPWHSYVRSYDCLDLALLENGWLDVEQLGLMSEVDRKTALIENLIKHLDGDVHSLPELSYRLK